MKKVAELIICHGGVNSLMSIRANELGLHTIIVAGEVKYQLWPSAKRLEIDCPNCRVEVLA